MDVGNPNSSQVIIDDLGEVIKLKTMTPHDIMGSTVMSDTLQTTLDVNNTIYAPLVVKEYNGLEIIPIVVQIGAWNMDTGDTKTVAHGLGAYFTNIVSMNVVIRTDSGGLIQPLHLWNYLSDSTEGGIYYIDNTNIILKRKTGGLFDSASYSDAVKNRGQIILWAFLSTWII